MSPQRPAAAVVLAAGEGTRMKSSLPKVLHPIAGRPLLGHALAAVAGLEPRHLLVVIGHDREQVAAYLAEAEPAATPVVQEEQLGTGHAVRTALNTLGDLEGTVLVSYGDVPLLTTQTLAELIAAHGAGDCAATVLATRPADPAGLGRIIRAADGSLASIVEERDASPDQRAIPEVNSGIYVFDAKLLIAALGRLSTGNSQGEEYLTDVIGILRADGHRVAAVAVADPDQALGVNDRVQLARVGRLLNDRLLEAWMRAGVSVIEPATTWVDTTVVLESDVLLHPGTRLHGDTVIRSGAVVGPDTTLRDTEVGAGAVVRYAVANGARIGPDATVGPYVSLRPGTKLARGVHVGTFVEMKNADVGTGTKVPHLSYVGDATIGEYSNIGAATVVVNYDGVAKHHTVIGDHARTGSGNMFVAPVTVGDGAYTAAGSVITEDVPPGAMGVSRAKQRNIAGWVERRRAGTAAAEAAARANREAEPDSGPGEEEP
ncbi:MAG TPA: bifunctional UDP-N-acetylglucosamine diphosphorylase/glucosamine-1-phosphate N-acetyltransferase GlmU [Actinomycetes bacterium]|nr:bifunctional UDP-N-acetylglucosamine diphosphorylase/glucosamine-1-phosphate N-acetyltransferase GlmU [Actinomycetes bacterium]